MELITLYKFRDTQRGTLTGFIADNCLPVPTFTRLEICRKAGSAKQMVGVLEIDEIAILEGPEAILDEIEERHGTSGGTLVIRAVFIDPEKPGTNGENRTTQERSVRLVRTKANERGKSEGASAGIEALTHSFGAAFDSQGRQLNSAVQQQTQLMTLLLNRTEEQHSVRLQEVTEYQRLIMDQQSELLTAKLELAYQERAPILGPETIATLLPAVVNLLQSVATWLTPAAPALEKAAEAASIAAGASPSPPS